VQSKARLPPRAFPIAIAVLPGEDVNQCVTPIRYHIYLLDFSHTWGGGSADAEYCRNHNRNAVAHERKQGPGQARVPSRPYPIGQVR